MKIHACLLTAGLMLPPAGWAHGNAHDTPKAAALLPSSTLGPPGRPEEGHAHGTRDDERCDALRPGAADDPARRDHHLRRAQRRQADARVRHRHAGGPAGACRADEEAPRHGTRRALHGACGAGQDAPHQLDLRPGRAFPCRLPGGRPLGRRHEGLACRSGSEDRTTLPVPAAASSAAPSLGGRRASWPAQATTLPPMQVWKSPTCGCCKDWIAILQREGFKVQTFDEGNNAARARLGLPARCGSCHCAHRRLRGRRPCAGARDPPTAGREARCPRHRRAQHAGGFAGHGRARIRRTARPYGVLLVLRDGSSRVYASYNA